MKSGNYDDLMDKFYAGTATDTEINWLASQGLINQQDNLYAEALKAERDQKTDWDFEDFINKMPAANVVTFSPGRSWMKRMIVAAASVAAILTGYIFWTQQQQPKEIASVHGVQKPVDSAAEPIIATLPVGDEIKKPVMVSVKQKREFMPSGESEPKTLEKKQGRARSKHAEGKMKAKADVEDFHVTVNGRSIINEEDAIAITRKSLAMLSLKLTSINELNPLDRVKQLNHF